MIFKRDVLGQTGVPSQEKSGAHGRLVTIDFRSRHRCSSIAIAIASTSYASCSQAVPMASARARLQWEPCSPSCIRQQLKYGFDDLQYWLPSLVLCETILHLKPMDVMKDNPIAILLGAFSGAATYLDRIYSLPLYTEVCHGRKWDHGMQRLAHAAPDALSYRDRVHALHPFLLAAMNESNSVDTVFMLLLANPSILVLAIFEGCGKFDEGGGQR